MRYFAKVFSYASMALLVWMLEGCASTSASVAGNDDNRHSDPATQKPQKTSNLSVDVKSVERKEGTCSDCYARLVTSIPGAESVFSTSIAIERDSSVLWNAIKDYFFKETKTEAVGVAVSIDNQSVGNFKPIAVDPTNPAYPAYSDHYLGPTFLADEDSIDLTFSFSYSSQADSHLLQATGTVLQTLSRVYAPNGLLFRAIGAGDISSKMQNADSAFAKAFDKTQVVTGMPTGLSPKSQERLDFYLNGSPKAAFALNFQLFETVFSPDGKAASVSPVPANLLGRTIPTPNSEQSAESSASNKSTQADQTYDSLFTGNTAAYANLNKNTADGFNAFCETMAKDLRSKGYNNLDRALLFYAILSTSQWNNHVSMRSENDQCEKYTIGYLPPQMALNNRDAIDPASFQNQSTNRSKIVAILEAKGGVWGKLSTGFQSPPLDWWSDFANDPVSVVSVGSDLQLPGIPLLKAGVSQSLGLMAARTALSSAQFKYDPARARKDGTITKGCYGIQGTQPSSFRGFCFYPQNGAAKQAMLIEFDFDKSFSPDTSLDGPKLTTIKFFP